MTTETFKTEIDSKDVLLAHKYRLSINKPRQSSFRVVALLFYSTRKESEKEEHIFFSLPEHRQLTYQNRHYVVGTNDEPCHIGGSICAERAAMVQLRFVRNIERVTKIVIVTDAPHEITPGLLCREFMSSSPLVPPDTPIVLGGSNCLHCHTTFEDSENCVTHNNDETHTSLVNVDMNRKSNTACCINAHNFVYSITFLEELYPYASPYVRLSAGECVKYGTSYIDSQSSNATVVDENEIYSSLLSRAGKNWGELSLNDENTVCKILIEKSKEAAASDGRNEVHPIQYGAVVLFSDGAISIAHQKKGIEYGCTLDAVGQLAEAVQQKCYSVGKSDVPRKLITPVLLVQTDQFGIAHAPFAPGRAFFAEHGYGDCSVLIHRSDCQKLSRVKFNELVPGIPKMDNGLLVHGA
jgi:hypothetical protein